MDAIGFGATMVVGGWPRAARFDFTGGVLPAGARLTRGSVARYHDASGTAASAAVDVARFDHHPATHAPRGLLIEPAATNVLHHSTDWVQSYWTRSMIDQAQAVALIETTATGGRQVFPTTADTVLTAGIAVTLSMVAAERAGSAKRYAGLSFPAIGFAAAPLALFDLATGQVTTSANLVSAGMAAAGGGAWLCWITVLPTGSTTGQQPKFRMNASATGLANYIGDGTSGIAISQAQLETGSAPTSRIATGASAVTRSADVLTLDWASRGVADGAITVRYTFDDASSQDVATTVSGGTATVPVLQRAWITRAERV